MEPCRLAEVRHAHAWFIHSQLRAAVMHAHDPEHDVQHFKVATNVADQLGTLSTCHNQASSVTGIAFRGVGWRRTAFIMAPLCRSSVRVPALGRHHVSQERHTEQRLRENSPRSYPTLSSGSRLGATGRQLAKELDPKVRSRPSWWAGARSSHRSRRTVHIRSLGGEAASSRQDASAVFLVPSDASVDVSSCSTSNLDSAEQLF